MLSRKFISIDICKADAIQNLSFSEQVVIKIKISAQDQNPKCSLKTVVAFTHAVLNEDLTVCILIIINLFTESSLMSALALFSLFD